MDGNSLQVPKDSYSISGESKDYGLELALRESEERLRLAIEIGQLASWDWDVLTGRINWNDRHYLLQGYGVGEVTPSFEAWVNRVHPEDRDLAVALIEQARDSHSDYVHEYRALLPDGQIRWCSTRGRFFYDKKGCPIRMIGVMEDVTERKLAESKLRQRESDLVRVQRICEVGGIDIDIAAGLTSRRSPEYLRLHGLPPESAYEEHSDWLASVHPEDRDRAKEKLREALMGSGNVYESEYRIIRPDNFQTRWIKAKADIERDPFGKPIRLVGAHIDVTEQKRLEDDIRESEKRQAFLLHLSDALRTLSSASEIQDIATQILAKQLNANRVLYAEAQDNHWMVTIGYESDVQPLPNQPFPMSTYGQWIVADFQCGRNLVVHDMKTDSRFSESERNAHLTLHIAAEVAVPLVKNGMLVAILVTQVAEPREWSNQEIETVCETAERTWAAVERAKAESKLRVEKLALRQSEAALRDLNQNLEHQVAERTKVAENRAKALKRYAEQLTNVEHRERKRLALLLHDDLQQYLVGVRYLLTDFVFEDSAEIKARLQKIDERLKQCLSISKNLTRELSPPVLSQRSIVASIYWLADYFLELHGFDVDVSAVKNVPDLPEILHVFLFQAIRELIFNAYKHSGQQSASVGILYEMNLLTIRVEDKGKSFSPLAIEIALQKPESFGLYQIKERLEILGGTLTIANSNTGGADIRISTPVQTLEDGRPTLYPFPN